MAEATDARETRRLVGMAGLFDDPTALARAAERVRDAGWRRWDCHTPYPVHGLDRAMGLSPSPIPAICLGAGFLGAGLALLMQGWMSVVDYPVRIGGKPLWSWPAFVPVAFELFVLLAALATFGALLFLGRLLRWHSPLYDAGVMAEVTTSRFAVVLDAADERFSEEAARALLAEAGSPDVRPLYEPVGEEEVR
jgi:hypothetical protein